MAICEEIERKIVIDDVTLMTRFREHPSLEEILNTWVVWKLHILVNFQFTEVLINLKCRKGADYWVNQQYKLAGSFLHLTSYV